MKPVKIKNINYDKYVYALCKCPLPLDYAIRMKKIDGQHDYKFYCNNCRTAGVVCIGR